MFLGKWQLQQPMRLTSKASFDSHFNRRHWQMVAFDNMPGEGDCSM